MRRSASWSSGPTGFTLPGFLVASDAARPGLAKSGSDAKLDRPFLVIMSLFPKPILVGDGQAEKRRAMVSEGVAW